jgi:hypothetical protein
MGPVKIKHAELHDCAGDDGLKKPCAAIRHGPGGPPGGSRGEIAALPKMLW